MTTNKKIIIAVTSIIVVILLYLGFNASKDNKPMIENNNNTDVSLEDKNLIDKSVLEILELLDGVYSNKLKIESNPLRLETAIFINDDNILNLIKYYLEDSKNESISDVEVVLKDTEFTLKADYKVFGPIKTPIELVIRPYVRENNDISIDIEDVKVIGLKINQELINNIVKGWFEEEALISVDNKTITINKELLNEITMNKIEIVNDRIMVDMNILLDKENVLNK